MSLEIKTSWHLSAKIISHALEHGTDYGKRLARHELMLMAKVADYAVELENKLNKAQEEIE